MAMGTAYAVACSKMVPASRERVRKPVRRVQGVPTEWRGGAPRRCSLCGRTGASAKLSARGSHKAQHRKAAVHGLGHNAGESHSVCKANVQCGAPQPLQRAQPQEGRTGEADGHGARRHGLCLHGVDHLERLGARSAPGAGDAQGQGSQSARSAAASGGAIPGSSGAAGAHRRLHQLLGRTGRGGGVRGRHGGRGGGSSRRRGLSGLGGGAHAQRAAARRGARRQDGTERRAGQHCGRRGGKGASRERGWPGARAFCVTARWRAACHADVSAAPPPRSKPSEATEREKTRLCEAPRLSCGVVTLRWSARCHAGFPAAAAHAGAGAGHLRGRLRRHRVHDA